MIFGGMVTYIIIELNGTAREIRNLGYPEEAPRGSYHRARAVPRL